jgi:hypothetical protein
MALSDDVERLAAIVVKMHQRDGTAARLRIASGRPASAIAKLCGATPEQVFAWESGTLQPSTQQALAWLGALHGGLATPGERMASLGAAAKRSNGR